MKNQQKQESKQTSFSSSEVHNGQHGVDCEECAKYVENSMTESDNEPDSFELESDELDAQFEDLCALIDLHRSEAHDWLRYQEIEEDRVSEIEKHDLSADIDLFIFISLL